MKKVTLTLDLTYAEAEAVLALLNGTTSEAPASAVEVKLVEAMLTTPLKAPPTNIELDIPVIVKPTAGKKVKMAGFGRSQKQIDDFNKDEQEKFNKKTDEQLLKEQRAEERAEAKKVKAQIAKDKKEEEDRATKEVEAIKKADTKTPVIATLPKKPWEI